MAHNTDELMSLADVYAAALLRAAEEKGQLDEVAAELSDLVRYMDEHPEFDQFLTASSVDDDPRRQSLEKLFRGRMNDLLLNMLQVLNNRMRLDLVRQVQRCVELRMEARRHQQEVEVETAMPLTDDLRNSIREVVGRRIGKEVILIEREDPSLIGGVVIHIDDVQIDACVASRVKVMRKRLFERATEEIHSGRGYVVEA
jgi:ATP synthase F1 delta subunit